MIKKRALLFSVMIFSSMLCMQDDKKNKFNGSSILSLDIMRHGDGRSIIDGPNYEQPAIVERQARGNNEIMPTSNNLQTKKLTISQKRRMRRKRSEAKREEHYAKLNKEWHEMFFKEEQEKTKSELVWFDRTDLNAWKVLEELLDEMPDESLWTIEDKEKMSSLFANFHLIKNCKQTLSPEEERNKMNKNEKDN